MKYPLIEVATHRAGWPHVFEVARILSTRARFSMVDSTVMAVSLAAQGAGIALARASKRQGGAKRRAGRILAGIQGRRTCILPPRPRRPGQASTASAGLQNLALEPEREAQSFLTVALGDSQS